MHSFISLSWIRTLLAGSGWMFIWIGFFASFIYAFHEHRDISDKIKDSTGKAQASARRKRLLMWSLPILTLLGAIGSQVASEDSDKKIEMAQGLASRAMNISTAAVLKATALDPRKQPMVIISASVRLRVRGTNVIDVTRALRDAEPEIGGAGMLQLGQFQSAKINRWHLHLNADNFQRLYHGGDICEYFMEFHMNRLNPMSNMEQGDLVEKIDELDTVCIMPYFLPDTEVLDGSVNLKVNSVVQKTFPIPPQRTTGVIASTIIDGTHATIPDFRRK